MGEFEQADPSAFGKAFAFSKLFCTFINHVAGREFADFHDFCLFGDCEIAQGIDFPEVEKDIAGDITIIL